MQAGCGRMTFIGPVTIVFPSLPYSLWAPGPTSSYCLLQLEPVSDISGQCTGPVWPCSEFKGHGFLECGFGFLSELFPWLCDLLAQGLKTRKRGARAGDLGPRGETDYI